MLIYTLKIALRNLIRNKTNSVMNILGLAIGMAACLLIVLYVKDELSFDTYHQNAERIFRVGLIVDDSEREEATFARSSTALANTLRKECPSVELAVRFSDVWGGVVRNGNGKLFFEKGTIYQADPDIFNLFTIPFIYGDPQTALSQPSNMVISEATAFKYFGKTNVIGDVLFFNENLPQKGETKQWKITGVFKDIPHNSHLPHFMLLIPLKPIDHFSEQAWELSSIATYIKVFQNTDIDLLEKEINRIAGQYNSAILKKNHRTHQYFLQALNDIHLFSNFMWEYAALGNLNEIITFSAIALLILGMACLNFINLSIAQVNIRGKEIGVRKVIGAHRNSIVRQFLTEYTLTTIIAFSIAMIFVELLLPGYNAYLGKELSVNFLSDPTFWLISVLIVIFVGLVAGSFPALFLASFKPTIIFSGLLPANRGIFTVVINKTLRNGLVFFQFVVSLVLIISALFVYQQISFMKNKDLGFHKSQMLVIPTQSIQMSHTMSNEFASIKSEFLQHHTILSVTKQVAAPGRNKFIEKIMLLDTGNAGEMFSFIEFIDSDYLDTYLIPLIAGRDYQRDRTTDKDESFLINETAAKALGFSSPEEAIHKRLSVTKPKFWQGEIIGVVRDFHFQSLHEKIGPLVCFTPKFNPESFTIRLDSQNIPETLAFLKKKWAAFFPNNPFEYYFIDEEFASFYQSEEKFGILIYVFTGLAILIACLGLFGMTSFSTENRKKEIGIRKVFGASISNVNCMLSVEFTKWIVLANIVAWPIAWYVMNKWQQNFAYHIDITLWPFLIAGATVLVISLLTVSSKAIQAATANPIETLRYE